MTLGRMISFLAIMVAPAMVTALEVPTGALPTTEIAASPEQLPIAIAPMADGTLPKAIIEGTLTRTAWRIPGEAGSTLSTLLPMVVQLEKDGYFKTFSCHDSQCGGFGFRFAIDVLPPPAMQVNLADFQYWTGTNDTDHVVILVSRIADTTYVQIDRIGPEPAATPSAAAAPQTGTFATRTAPDSLPARLAADGRVILPGLSFAPGSSSLAEGANEALDALADILLDDPALRVALVGHTDAAGSLAGNIALSKRRAQSVRTRLINQYDVPSGQLAAEGMGYLAPVATNRTTTGREANRRVEVIVLNTD